MKKPMLNKGKASPAATVEAQSEKPNTYLGNSIMNNTTLQTEIQNISTFQFGEFSIRVVSINNEPWFIAKDVCDTLGIKNPSQALENLDEDERAMFNIGRSKVHGGGGEVNIVSESGMYTLILRCRDAVKKGSIPHRFRKWVTAEVLPTIRKTGKYEHKTTVDDRTGLRNAVNMLVSKKGLIYSDAYNLVHQYMNVESIEDIPADKLQSAVEYVHKIALEGELIETKPEPKVNEPLLNEHDLQTVAWAAFIMARNADMFVDISPALNALHSEFAPAVCGMAHGYRSVIKDIHALANRLTESIQYDYDSNWRVLKHIRNFNPKAKYYVNI